MADTKGDDRLFVIRLHHPRFIGIVEQEALVWNVKDFVWIDDPSDDPLEVARIMREVADYIAGELE
jgi:hypothetical protein